MGKKRIWSDQDLIHAVKHNFSMRQVLLKLGLVEAGGNYQHVQRIIRELNLDTSHFLGKGWAKNQRFSFRKKISFREIMVKNSSYQSHKLKERLFIEGIKQKACELCGWNLKSLDGRIPLELDHINGVHTDQRLSNLRILCPNCHALQLTHRGRNKKKGPVAKRYTRKT